MKKKYTTPEVRLVMLGEEMMVGLKQESVQPDGDLPDGTHIGNKESDGSDPEAKIGGRFWDDEY